MGILGTTRGNATDANGVCIRLSRSQSLAKTSGSAQPVNTPFNIFD